jgi:hypothetical protein
MAGPTFQTKPFDLHERLEEAIAARLKTGEPGDHRTTILKENTMAREDRKKIRRAQAHGGSTPPARISFFSPA